MARSDSKATTSAVSSDSTHVDRAKKKRVRRSEVVAWDHVGAERRHALLEAMWEVFCHSFELESIETFESLFFHQLGIQLVLSWGEAGELGACSA